MEKVLPGLLIIESFQEFHFGAQGTFFEVNTLIQNHLVTELLVLWVHFTFLSHMQVTLDPKCD